MEAVCGWVWIFSGIAHFAIAPVNSVFKLPNRQLIFFEEFNQQKNCEINFASQNVFGAI